MAPIKLWMPQRLRDDLQSLADHVGLKLSQYLREIVIARLLGHGTLPMRPEMLQASPGPATDDWVEDREIPWRVVSRDDYQTAREGKIEVDWEEGAAEEER